MEAIARANRDATRRIIEDGLGGGDLAVLDELMAVDVAEHQRGNPPGRAGARLVFAGLRRAFPDLRVEIVHLDAVDDRVWVHFRASGTLLGPFFDVTGPTGRSMRVDVIDVLRFRDGVAVEHWGVPDQLGMLEQVGALPEGA
jgi:predicted ester cyclase